MAKTARHSGDLLAKHYAKYKGKSRFDLHRLHKMSPCDVGYLPFHEEVQFCLPQKARSEDLFIYGANSQEKTIIEVYFRRTPILTEKFDPPKDRVEISLKLYDTNGDLYWMEESSEVNFAAHEFKACGFAYEPLQANKIGRIKFRGYLRKNFDEEDKLYYVQMRFLCLFFSKPFDHQRQYDLKFRSKQLKQSKVSFIEQLLEDTVEQFCQIKGTFKVEAEQESELFFLGTVGKRFQPTKSQPIKIVTKICGFNQDGLGFQIGQVELVDKYQSSFRYGFASKAGKNSRLLKNMRNVNFNELVDNEENVVKFEAKFRGLKILYKFEIGPFHGNWRVCKVNGIEGLCYVEQREYDEIEQFDQEDLDRGEDCGCTKSAMVVAFDEEVALVASVTGGKGSSLARLKRLSKGTEWDVPNGIIVTSNSYRVQTETMDDFAEELATFQSQVYSRNNVENACNDMVNWFTSYDLYNRIQFEIEDKLVEQFGETFESVQFAVRSSATFEDSNELSAAGQMTTFLGVRGLANLCAAVVKCWASQFAFVPIEYKRSYGLPLNSPMAVIIQEMVSCDSAGVCFTADPSTGDERILTVTSNFGLGESVVSASAEPDTFQLAVYLEANSYEVPREVDGIISKTLGKKSLVTKLNPDVDDKSEIESGVLNVDNPDGETSQSIADEDLVQLGSIALEISSHYGNPRDIEWGLSCGHFYIFQSRPITALDSNFTDYELIHEMDTPHMSEREIYSRAHWGENFPGSSSWGSCEFMFPNDYYFILVNSLPEMDFNPYKPMMGTIANQLMFNVTHEPCINVIDQYPESELVVSMVHSLFGRDITHPEVLQAIEKARVDPWRNFTWKTKAILAKSNFSVALRAKPLLRKYQKDLFFKNKYSILGDLDEVPWEDRWYFILTLAIQKIRMANKMHGPLALWSSLNNHLLRMTLRVPNTDPEDQKSDFNQLLSHCNDVVSAEVPDMLRQIAKLIGDKETFVKLSDEEALQTLKSQSDNASTLFQEFLHIHGHRGFKEFDPLYPPWAYNPMPCVQAIKSLLKSKDESNLGPKMVQSTTKLFSKLKTPLSWWRKALIRGVHLPLCRNAVGYREQSKSLFVKHMFHIREAMICLSQDMVQMGVLPEEDLIYFLKIDEIQKLTTGEGNAPMIVAKAKHRKRLFPQMNRLKFEEFVSGFRMAPKETKKEPIHIPNGAICLKGTAVTLGETKGRVCVADTIDDAVNLQPGDILLTYSTDIGWSPYFPLLSGIVTEIGGTISHGAVIAREYGIPCLVAVENVCSYFETGDLAYLDCKTGKITKLER